jgi:L-lactate utilization protein LutB
MEKLYYQKRGQILVNNLKNRHFDAWYCDTKEAALEKALELIPEGATVGWGGVLSAQQIGLFDALREGNYNLYDRDRCETAEQREQMMKDALFSDVFLTGANGLSLDGQMVNIDGTGNRVGAMIAGPKEVIVVAGANKLVDGNIAQAIARIKTVACPQNARRLGLNTPCGLQGKCDAAHCEKGMCNVTSIIEKPVGGHKITIVLVDEEAGY